MGERQGWVYLYGEVLEDDGEVDSRAMVGTRSGGPQRATQDVVAAVGGARAGEEWKRRDTTNRRRRWRALRPALDLVAA